MLTPEALDQLHRAYCRGKASEEEVVNAVQPLLLKAARNACSGAGLRNEDQEVAAKCWPKILACIREGRISASLPTFATYLNYKLYRWCWNYATRLRRGICFDDTRFLPDDAKYTPRTPADAPERLLIRRLLYAWRSGRPMPEPVEPRLRPLYLRIWNECARVEPLQGRG